MNLSVGNAVVQKEENIAIKGYVIRKTLELLFFSSHFSFSLKKQKKTEQTKIPKQNPFRCSYKYFRRQGGDPITEKHPKMFFSSSPLRETASIPRMGSHILFSWKKEEPKDTETVNRFCVCVCV